MIIFNSSHKRGIQIGPILKFRYYRPNFFNKKKSIVVIHRPEYEIRKLYEFYMEEFITSKVRMCLRFFFFPPASTEKLCRKDFEKC